MLKIRAEERGLMFYGTIKAPSCLVFSYSQEEKLHYL